MDDTVAWRHDSEVVKGFLAPLEEGKALLVAVELDLLVLVLRVEVSCHVDLNRVVNYQVDLAERVDFCWIASEFLHLGAHRSEVHNRGHSSEVLQKYASGLERHLNVVLAGLLPVQNILDVGSCKGLIR